MTRSPLDKPRFLKTVRQIWLAVLLACAGVVLVADVWGEIAAAPYLDFLTITGATFILGSSVDSALKIRAFSEELKKE